MSKTTEMFRKAFDAGWIIEPTSCVCGGRYAWLYPGKGGYVMYGCICHNDPDLNLTYIEKLMCNDCGGRLIYTGGNIDLYSLSYLHVCADCGKEFFINAENLKQ